jgi:hypothetical protein
MSPVLCEGGSTVLDQGAINQNLKISLLLRGWNCRIYLGNGCFLLACLEGHENMKSKVVVLCTFTSTSSSDQEESNRCKVDMRSGYWRTKLLIS